MNEELTLTDQDIRLAMGELTASELLVARAAINWRDAVWRRRAADVQPAIPTGFKLVPIEPTFEMWDAAENASVNCDVLMETGKEREHGAYEFPTQRIWGIVCAYRAMLTAAPSSEAIGHEVKQDACSGLSQALSNKPDARMHAREAADRIVRESGEGA